MYFLSHLALRGHWEYNLGGYVENESRRERDKRLIILLNMYCEIREISSPQIYKIHQGKETLAPPVKQLSGSLEGFLLFSCMPSKVNRCLDTL